MLLWPFNKYPGTDYETFNWEWILKTVKDWSKNMAEFVNDITDDIAKMHRDFAVYVNVTENALNTGAIANGAITKEKINQDFLPEIENHLLTPQMFGAVADGNHDDTTAIQQALTAAETDPSHTVYFPKGRYNVAGTGSIFNSKFVSLVGNNAEIFVTQGNDNTDLFTFTGTAQNYNGQIKGLEFNYDDNNYTMIRHVFNFVFQQDSDILYNMCISDCLFRKNAGYKIYTQGWTNGGFNNCKFNDNIVYGKFIKSLSYGDSNQINGNSLYGAEDILLHAYIIDLVQTAGSAGCEISNNNCTSGLGSMTNFSNLHISGNQVENTEQVDLDYLIKITGGNNVTIEDCHLNAHYNSNLVFMNIVNGVIRNCNFYGTKPNGYALDTGNAHLIKVENPRYFDGANVKYMLDGDVVNGYATDTLYNVTNATYYIDISYMLHFLPKAAATVSIAPLQCDVNTTEAVYVPVEKINDDIATLRITYRYQLYAETVFTVPATIPVRYF